MRVSAAALTIIREMRKTNFVRSALPRVVRSTMFVNPMPYSLSRASSYAFNCSVIRPDRKRHFPARMIFLIKSITTRHSSVVVSTSMLYAFISVQGLRPGPGMGMFGVKPWLSTLGTMHPYSCILTEVS